MTSTIYLDTVKKVARASITGTAQPSVPAKLLAHLKLIIKFFGADGVIAVDADTPTCVIKPKLAPTGAPSLIDTTAVRTGTGATSQYVFEWASADSTALRAVMDATGDPTQPVELRCEVEYELDGNLERIAFPTFFETSYTRPEDPAPEANTDSSWEWLKLRAPEANGFSHDDVERELTVAGGAGSGDVVGPASSVDSRPALFNGTTGKLLKQGSAALGDAAYKNTGSTAGTLAAGDDARMTNARTPTAHASTHLTGGSDAIQEATAAQPGLATAAQITKLDGIEALADVTDAGNVGTAISAADAVTSLADADKLPITASGVLKTIAYSALKTLLNALYAIKGTITDSGLTMSTARLLGRSTASSGAIEEITLGSGLTLTAGTLSATGGGGSGDVVGPASTTDNALVRYDGTTGKLVQNGQVTQSDTGDLAAINSMTMDTTPAGSLATQGQMMWNSVEETLDIQLNGFALHVGEHVVYHVQNSTGSTIAKGVPVMFAGTTGNSGKLLIQPWNGTGPSTLFMGLTGESLITGSEGFVIAFGKVRGIQTDGANYGQTWVDGEIIYAGTTTGSLTKTQPSAPNPIVQVLAVVHAHASNGTYFIRPNYILGDVFGPASATDNALVRFDSTTGKLIQNSVATLTDNGTIAAIQLLCTTGSGGGDALVRAANSAGSVSLTTNPDIALNFDGETSADPPVIYGIKIKPSPSTQDSYDLVLPPVAGTAGQVLSINYASLPTIDLGWSNAGTGDAMKALPLSQFASTTSDQLRGIISDEVGTGSLVFAQSPTLIAPILGTPTSGNLINCTGIPGIPLFASKTDTETLATSAWTDISGLSIAFQASSITQKILIRACLLAGNPSTATIIYRLVNEDGTLLQGDAASNRLQAHAFTFLNSTGSVVPVTFEVVYTPGTISPRTYKVQWYRQGTGSVFLNRSVLDTDSVTFSRTASTLFLQSF